MVEQRRCQPSILQALEKGMLNGKRPIGILTGGGDCPGLNAVIRAAVRTARSEHDLDVVGIQLGFEGLLTNAVVPLTAESIRGILPKGGTLLRTTNRGNPFEYPAPDGSCIDRSAEVVDNIHALGIDGIIAIGGDGTLRNDAVDAEGVDVVD